MALRQDMCKARAGAPLPGSATRSLYVDGIPVEGDISCYANCDSQSSGQLECIEGCNGEAAGGPTATPPPPPPGVALVESTSCVNGVCTTERCDESGNCVTETDDEGSGSTPEEAGDSAPTSSTPGSPGAGESVTCINGVCTTCDDRGNCVTEVGEGASGDVPEGGGGGTTTSSGPISTGSYQNISCINGVCTAETCDDLGNCVTEDVEDGDEDDVFGDINFSGDLENPAPEPSTADPEAVVSAQVCHPTSHSGLYT